MRSTQHLVFWTDLKENPVPVEKGPIGTRARKKSKVINLHCKVCLYDWTSRLTNPLQCPACKNRYWKTAITAEGDEAISVVDGNAAERARP